MKIVNKGVQIVAGGGSIYHEINITPEDGIYVNGASWSRAEVEDIRDALTEALHQLDAMTEPA